MALLAVTDITEAGVAITPVAANAGGDTFVNDSSERTGFRVINGGGGSITVTFDRVPTSVPVPGYGNLAMSDNAVAVPAGQTREFGPFPPAAYNNAAGQVSVAYSGVTSVTVAPYRLARAAG